jgi:hypothetical protein
VLFVIVAPACLDYINTVMLHKIGCQPIKCKVT